MQYFKKSTLVIMAAAFLLMTAMATPAFSGDPGSDVSAEGMALDFVLLRPMGLAVTAIGCVFYVATFPLTVWNEKSRKQAGQNFVVDPAVYTFVRPLGELEGIPKGF
jgi:hypothetical protein